MNNDERKGFCLSMLKAETEEEIITLLKNVGYWDDPAVWRLYGDKEGNYATAGAQQAEPEAAFVEKIVNSVDACLINECLARKIKPESAEAPDSIRHAVARFFEGKKTEYDSGGVIRDWSRTKRTEQAKNITLAATGSKKCTCLTIADQGEGQTPNRVPDTILSLNRKNKQRIRFVQGKFNMGGTGVLRHCHDHSLQLVISKRNPGIVDLWNEGKYDDSADSWGLTIVRRERPTGKVGDVINSEFKYLAPTKDDPKGGVLRFKADALPLMPEYNDAYVRNMTWGTVIKLYGYDLSAGSSHILRSDGLIYRLEALLPEIALPVRVHECRKYFKGDREKSFATNLGGLTVRLEEGKGNNLEEYPWDVSFSVHGLRFIAKIYVFRKNKYKTYLRNEGVIFTINGQTHGYIPKSIFGRKKVGLPRIGRDLVVIVDCSDIPVDAREDLFMSSRDRLSKGELRTAIERQLEEILSTDSKLKAMQEKRRLEDQSDRLAGQKPLEEVLNNILKSSPSLSSLFLHGQRLSMPKRLGEIRSVGKLGGQKEGYQAGSETGVTEFVGEKHPTYFRFEKSPNKDFYHRNYERGRIARVGFETDVENEYFTRADYPGRYNLELVSGDIDATKISHSLNLHDGIAQWSISLSNDVVVGEKITLRCIIDDDIILKPFINNLELTVKPKSSYEPSGGKPRKKHRAGSGEKESPASSGMELPNIEKVKEGDKHWYEYEFDKKSGCAVVGDPVDVNGERQYEYTFYVNVDNIYLQNEMKLSKEPELDEAKFVYGNVLLGLSLIHDYDETKRISNGNGEDQDNEFIIENHVKRVSRSMSPFLIPMINYLGNLTLKEVSSLSVTGDEE